MYIKGGEYLGEYSNNEDIANLNGAEDFGLDHYEPEFFASAVDWNGAGTYEIALKFDVDDFTGKYGLLPRPKFFKVIDAGEKMPHK